MPASTGRRIAYAPSAKVIQTLACLCACGENPGQSSNVYAKPSAQRAAPEIPPLIPLPVSFGAFRPRQDMATSDLQPRLPWRSTDFVLETRSGRMAFALFATTTAASISFDRDGLRLKIGLA